MANGLKLVIHYKQFFNQNEPAIAAAIGNISMLLGCIVGFPALISQFGVAVPAIIVQVSTIAGSALLGIKYISKTLGVVDATGKPVNVSCPPVTESGNILKPALI